MLDILVAGGRGEVAREVDSGGVGERGSRNGGSAVGAKSAGWSRLCIAACRATSHDFDESVDSSKVQVQVQVQVLYKMTGSLVEETGEAPYTEYIGNHVCSGRAR
jgi:hypothetical protein